MPHDTTADTIPAGPEMPEHQAREAVEAMRATGPLRPETERAILAADRGHARVLAKIGVEAERPE